MALLSASEMVSAAAAINSDLIPRFRKWRIGQSEAAHEESVMRRLKNARWGIFLTELVQPDEKQGDSFLPDQISSPSAWKAKFGELISRAKLDHDVFQALNDEADKHRLDRQT